MRGDFRIAVYFIFLTSFLAFLSCSPTADVRAQKGVLDLRDYPLAQQVISLDGEWDFAWQQYYTSGKKIDFHELYVLPKLWPGHRLQTPKNKTETLPVQGYGVWHLRILLPNDVKYLAFKVQDMASNYELFANRKKIGSNGTFALNKQDAHPQYLPNIYFFEANIPVIDVYLNVSNYHAYTSGQWDSIWIGEENKISALREFNVASEVFFIGVLFLLGVYHVMLFLLNRKNKVNLLFAAFTLLASLRIAMTGERYLIYLFPHVPWVFYTKLEYLVFYLALPFFVTFLHTVFPAEVPRKFTYVIQAISSFFVVTLFAFSIAAFPWAIPSYQIITAISGFLIFIFLLKALRKKRHGVVAFMFGWGVFFLTLLNDMLVTSGILHTPLLTKVGVFFFIMAQAYILALRSSLANKEIQSLTEHLQKSNQAFLRFVPKEFLSFLGKKDLTEIELGEQVKKKMSILFSDIRSFTEISENLKLKENFDFVNYYFTLMGPIIRAHNGFIDKYLGDGIMALFPGNPTEAVKAAIEMQNAMLIFNEVKSTNIKFPVRIGIGVHTGHLMLGTIGERERMQGSVISDAVNLSSRLENLTQKYGADIIVSQETFKALQKQMSQKSRYLGFTKVKGKKQEIEIYEIFCHSDSQGVKLKLQTKEDFEKALNYFFKKRYVSAKKYLEKVVARNPHDKAAHWFLAEIQQRQIPSAVKKQ